MENRWTVLKVVALVLLAILVSCVSLNASAQEKPELKGGMQLTPYIPCQEEMSQKRLLCVMVEKDGKQYLILHDERGEFKIFVIEKDVPKLIWARDTI